MVFFNNGGEPVEATEIAVETFEDFEYVNAGYETNLTVNGVVKNKHNNY